MNKPLTFALILISLTSLCIMETRTIWAVSENSWTSKAPMLREVEGLGVAVVQGKIYVIGGNFDNNNEMYDPAADTWASLAPLPTGRWNFGIAVHQNKIYVIGGQNDTNGFNTPNYYYQTAVVTGVNEVYDPVTNTWETKTPMPTPRNYLQANVVDGKIYLIGGQHQAELEFPSGKVAEHSSNLTEVYDPETDTWTSMAAIPNTVYGYASVAANEKIYIISGWGVTSPLSNLVQIFDPKTNSWSLGKPIPVPVNQAAAGATTGTMSPKRIYVIGGRPYTTGGGEGSNITQIYDPETDTWTNGTDMSTKRYDLAVAVVNDLLYAMGGASFSLTAANEQYTPIGYGTVTQPPSPSPSPSPSPTQSPSPTPTPTASPPTSPSLSPSVSQLPATSPSESQSAAFPAELFTAAVVSIATIAIVIAAVAVLRRRKQ